jgi:hypothetical protein
MLPNILGILGDYHYPYDGKPYQPTTRALGTKKGVSGLKKLAMDREVTNDD